MSPVCDDGKTQSEQQGERMTDNSAADGVSEGQTFRASVVIPAHNEQSVITRCLQSLADQDVSRSLQIVVAANGCTDETVERARAFSGLSNLTVLDLSEPSKSGALNAGDGAATVFPRIYLDADITLAPGAVRAMIDALDVSQPRIAAPGIRFDLSRSSLPVREFFTIFTELPYVKSGLVGLGVYGMSEAGRNRFEEFPAIIADDLFAQRVFKPSERVIVNSEFVVCAPRDISNLVKVRTRVARGNAELSTVRDHPPESDFDPSTRGTAGALISLIKQRPVLFPAAVCYLGVTVMARVNARRTASAGTWDRDTSTR